jgi:putative pyruvate formate lyase activating enzyme
MRHVPSYLVLDEPQWKEKIDCADAIAAACALCPRQCGVNRGAGERGFCDAPGHLFISSIFPHHGEEPPFSGSHGSGTVFFSFCTLRCPFCQNYQISHEGEGRQFSEQELAGKMLGLQQQGCHNINLVTATHFLPWFLRSLRIAARGGLEIPILYNCGGYENAEALDVLNGIVDIYLPDMKFGDNADALRYCRAGDYVEVNQRAVRSMFKQVGPLRIDTNGIAYRGMCIRHLVLPNGKAGSGKILDFLLSTFDPSEITISLMAQYRPMYKAPAIRGGSAAFQGSGNRRVLPAARYPGHGILYRF